MEEWIDLKKIKIGYEISFNKYLYHSKPLQPILDVSSEILELQVLNKGLFKKKFALQ